MSIIAEDASSASPRARAQRPCLNNSLADWVHVDSVGLGQITHSLMDKFIRVLEDLRLFLLIEGTNLVQLRVQGALEDPIGVVHLGTSQQRSGLDIRTGLTIEVIDLLLEGVDSEQQITRLAA